MKAVVSTSIYHMWLYALARLQDQMKLRHGSRLKGFEYETPFLNTKIHLFYIEKGTSTYMLHLLIL